MRDKSQFTIILQDLSVALGIYADQILLMAVGSDPWQQLTVRSLQMGGMGAIFLVSVF